MAISIFWKIFAFSLSSIPICVAANKMLTHLIQLGVHSAVIALTGLALLGFYGAFIFWAFRSSLIKHKINDPFFYGFAVFAFTSVIDFCIGLELDGYISDFLTSYLLSGEPYLNSPYGALIMYFDGFAMYGLYLYMIYAISNKKCYRSAAIYWAGTLINSMIVLLLGILSGKYGVFPTTIMNVPYAVFPVIVLWKVLHKRPTIKATSPQQPLCKRPIDVALIVALIFTIFITFLRALAVIGDDKRWLVKYYLDEIEPVLLFDDPCPFNLLQMLQNLYYFVPMQLLAICALCKPGCTWMPDMALFYAGAICQAQFSHALTAVHDDIPQEYRTSPKTWVRNTFWTVNLLYVLVPHLLLLRCWKNPEFFAEQTKPTKSKSKSS